MKTLEEFKNEQAENEGYSNWAAFYSLQSDFYKIEIALNSAFETFTAYLWKEACRLQRELCADNAVTKWDSNKEEPFDIIVDKYSIINSPCPKL